MQRQAVPALSALLLLAGCGLDPNGSQPPQAVPLMEPEAVVVSEPIAAAKAVCPSGQLALAVASPRGGVSAMGNGEGSAMLTGSLSLDSGRAGQVFSWDSNLGVDSVIVQGGDTALIYTYNAEATSGSGLHAPLGAGDRYVDVSRITFCYDVEVLVRHVPDPSLVRAHAWKISKEAWNNTRTKRLTELELRPGFGPDVSYDITVGPAETPYTDSQWLLEGRVTISNPAPKGAVLKDLSVEISGGLVPSVTCEDETGKPVSLGQGAPYTLSALDTLQCRYSVIPGDSRPRTVTVSVTTDARDITESTDTPDDAVRGNSHITPVDFSQARVTHIDECVDVYDEDAQGLPTLCVGETPLPWTVSFNKAIKPFETSKCGSRQGVGSVASFKTTDDANDTDASGATSSAGVFQVKVVCD